MDPQTQQQINTPQQEQNRIVFQQQIEQNIILGDVGGKGGEQEEEIQQGVKQEKIDIIQKEEKNNDEVDVLFECLKNDDGQQLMGKNVEGLGREQLVLELENLEERSELFWNVYRMVFSEKEDMEKLDLNAALEILKKYLIEFNFPEKDFKEWSVLEKAKLLCTIIDVSKEEKGEQKQDVKKEQEHQGKQQEAQNSAENAAALESGQQQTTQVNGTIPIKSELCEEELKTAQNLAAFKYKDLNALSYTPSQQPSFMQNNMTPNSTNQQEQGLIQTMFGTDSQGCQYILQMQSEGRGFKVVIRNPLNGVCEVLCTNMDQLMELVDRLRRFEENTAVSWWHAS
eukprot:TRINITY_DN3135_c0_g1_i1.p2 TRINITY_DN3135_c0_g1~~TRINITY_DN3135_c0_g1_i1.p2  ORF type:complete len:341 (+),score=90.40 TRINITY_DN3135_c0_g1_i1:300-1322(+)